MTYILLDLTLLPFKNRGVPVFWKKTSTLMDDTEPGLHSRVQRDCKHILIEREYEDTLSYLGGKNPQ